MNTKPKQPKSTKTRNQRINSKKPAVIASANDTTEKEKKEKDSQIRQAWTLATKIHPEIETVRKLVAACGEDLHRKFIFDLVTHKTFAEANKIAIKMILNLVSKEIKAGTELTDLIFRGFEKDHDFFIDFVPLLRSLGIKSTEAILTKLSDEHLSFAEIYYPEFGFKSCFSENALIILEKKRLEEEEKKLEEEKILLEIKHKLKQTSDDKTVSLAKVTLSLIPPLDITTLSGSINSKTISSAITSFVLYKL